MAIDPYFLPHLQDLERASSKQYRTIGSSFLTLEESAYAEKAFQGKANFMIDGGYEEAERKRIFFAPEGEEIIPELALFRIYPRGKKFGVALTHRNTLGAVLGLGLKREAIGDVIIGDGDAYVFASPSLSSTLSSLSEVGRESVEIEEIPVSSFAFAPKIEEKRITLASLRLDAFVSEAFSLSRETAKKAVTSGLVSLNGSLCQKADQSIEENDRISLKGKGKRKVISFEGVSKKGKQVVALGIYR